MKLTVINPAKKVIQDFSISGENTLIFQDLFTAYFFLLSSNSKKVKTILILHCADDPLSQLMGYYPSLLNTRFHLKLLEFKNFVYSHIDHVVFLSNNAFNFNAEHLKNKSSVIYNGISSKNYVEKAKIKLDEIRPVNIVCVGSINGHKGQELIIDAIVELIDNDCVNFKLFFIGSGSEEGKLKQRVDENKLENYVEFLGVRNDVERLLSKMDVMLLPSKSEGMPISILEGMRQGMYILCTPVGALPEMINDRFGQFIDRSAKSIFLALKRLLKNRHLIVEGKLESQKQFYNKFTEENMINNYSKIMNELNEKNY